MRKHLLALVAILGSTLVLGMTGCSKSHEGAKIDTSRVTTAFKDAPPVQKEQVQTALAELKTNNFSGAMSSLGQVAQNVQLTPEQKSAVQDLMTQVRTNALDMGHEAAGAFSSVSNKADNAMDKATEGVKKTINH